MEERKLDFAGVIETLINLPVADIGEDVVASAQEGKVTILTAETGSGKTLLANSMLADASDHQVVVLVPRRFLAINAAETIAELAGVELGEEVGFAVGRRSGDKSQFTPDTKLLFATYGYALRAGLIDTAKTIVLDEVHEAGEDTSLVRAMLHKRKQNDPELNIVEMSATLNAQKQAQYWEDVADTALHHADGQAFPCEFRTVKSNANGIEHLALDLIEEEGRKGIAIFRPGVGEVENTASQLRRMILSRGLENVEVAVIYGDMDMEERAEATKPPQEGNVKILVGTNVIESGANIKWLDTGISDGTCKIPYHRENGADALVVEELPQWRIIQQEGRVKRFTDGVFVLASYADMESREQEATPEIERVDLTRLVMHTAHFGENPLDLKFDANVRKAAFYEAKEDLQRLELMNDDWTLTEKGHFAMTVSVGPEAASMLYDVEPAILKDAIELAAVVDIGGLRADYKLPHGIDNSSDTLDGLKAFKKLGTDATGKECGKLNVSWKRYKELKGLIEDLSERLGSEEVTESRKASNTELRQIMLKGSVNRMFESREPYIDLKRNVQEHRQDGRSAVKGNDARFAIGRLREIPSRSGDPITIVTNITKISKGEFVKFAASRNDVLTDISFERNAKGRDSLVGKYFGKTPVRINITKNPSEDVQKLIEPAYSEFRHEIGDDVPTPPEKPSGIGNTGAEEINRQRSRGR